MNLRTEPVDLFEVYTTNADQEQLKLLLQGFSRDIAESCMVKKFTQSGFAVDFMLYNRSKAEITCECLTARTIQLRNGCAA